MKATERIANVLSLFTATAPERTTADVARLSNVANSTAHELLNGLADAGLLSRQAPGRFRLGPRIAQLAETLYGSDTLIEASRPVVVGTANTYGETCHVFALAESRIVSMTSSEGRAAVRVARNAIDQDTPIHACAPGKLLLSARPLAELNRVLSDLALPRVTPKTVTQKSVLRDEIADIRQRGFAEEVGQLDKYLATIAAPVRNHSGVIVGCFSQLIPAGRFTEQRRAYRSICLEAARTISRRLGWEDPIAEPERNKSAPARHCQKRRELQR